MNQYITGSIIKQLREKNHFTQAELAEKLNVSDKTISKWETAKGYLKSPSTLQMSASSRMDCASSPLMVMASPWLTQA